ncbi:hypothetical protein [Natrarchaeobius chitinivorans]|uniref:hypothetical protein n=1 Tax=Natrarchaeobius chitinivorans TaxID=1679083 RepID=UPI0014043157|nr:hypothetical protein [Natrarchaeobius chitinivorans]
MERVLASHTTVMGETSDSLLEAPARSVLAWDRERECKEYDHSTPSQCVDH